MQYKLKGNTQTEVSQESSNSFLGNINEDLVINLTDERSSGEDQDVHDLDCDDLIEVVTDDGLSIFTTVEAYANDFLPTIEHRGAHDEGDTIIIGNQIKNVGQQSRGFGCFTAKIIKKISFKAIDNAGEKIAHVIAKKIENSLTFPPGLYKVNDIRENTSSDGQKSNNHSSIEKLSAENLPSAGKPVLIFIHGTASSTHGSFSQFWQNGEHKQITTEWEELSKSYGEHIYGLEHRTLTESPIKNAINLLEALPREAEVHLVSHSRGGLVAELICRGNMEEKRLPFSQDCINYFKSSGNDEHKQQAKDLQYLSKLLEDKAILVKKLVRVGCPARGTTLASERLDIYLSTILNVIGFIPWLKQSIFYDAFKALLLATAKERTKPSELPGLSAQMPTSPLVKMLNYRRDICSVPLYVIAGDIEPKGIFKKLAMLLVDRFYQSDHDLVVNTTSMDGGSARSNFFIKYYKGSDINHFSYFKNTESRKLLTSALLSSTAKVPGFQHHPNYSRERYIVSRSAEIYANRPTAIILPGIAGSHLEIGGNRIWIDPVDLAWNGLAKLSINKSNIEPESLVASAYANLIDYFSTTHNVRPIPYDWRKSIQGASETLASEISHALKQSTKPIHIIAHSMGGLVAKYLIANHPKIWSQYKARKDSRIIMLGTPNDGSYSIVRLLCGHDKLIKRLALLDLKNNIWEIASILGKYPGILELLPQRSSSTDLNFYSEQTWNEITEALFSHETPRDWLPPAQQALTAAQETWDVLNKVDLDPEYVFYIAGNAKSTPHSIKLSNQEIHFYATSRGDGRVPWSSGIPTAIKSWMVQAEHGELADFKPAFIAYKEILETGNTNLIQQSVIQARSARDETDRLLPMPADLVDILPAPSDINPCAKSNKATNTSNYIIPPVNVVVKHGNLCFAKHPIIVGHYIDDTLVSAEKHIDIRLGGKLRDRLNLGLYPGRIGTSEIITNQSSNTCYDQSSNFPGCIVIGLGDLDDLSQIKLYQTLSSALLRYVLSVRENPNSTSDIGISTLLVGTGAGRITIADSIQAILLAISDTNKKLLTSRRQSNQYITSVEIVELYEDISINAHEALLNKRNDPTLNSHFHFSNELKKGDAGRRRIRFQEDLTWWDRLRIKINNNKISYLFLGSRAGIPSDSSEGALDTARLFVDELTRNTSRNEDAGRALFELLVAKSFKQQSQDSKDLVLLLDEDAAIFPWEALELQGNQGNEPFALRAALLRQLAIEKDLFTTTSTNGKALIIADPDYGDDSKFPPLLGAQTEGSKVALELTQKGYQANCLINPSAITTLSKLLNSNGHQILHCAGHGVFEYIPEVDYNYCNNEQTSRKVTGMVIGKNQFLSASIINQLTIVPELVFLNCCHLGNTANNQSTSVDKPHRIAANLAAQFIRNGAKAVIAAGWAVNDDAAELFATTFYKAMLSGEYFGKAVLKARQTTYNRFPNSNTWCAYQCYGAQDFTISQTKRKRSSLSIQHFHTENEALCVLENYYQDLKAADKKYSEYIYKQLDNLAANMKLEWLNKGTVQLAFAKAWGELLDFDKAIMAYEKAITATDSSSNIQAIEQLANLKSRRACYQLKQNYSVSLNASEKNSLTELAIEECNSAIEQMEKLIEDYGKTHERLSILASGYKKRAHCKILRGRNCDLRAAVTSLTTAASKYRESMGLADTAKHYSSMNYLSVVWLISKLDHGTALPSNFDHQCDQLWSLVDSPQSFQHEFFWNNVAYADTKFFHLLRNNSSSEEYKILANTYTRILNSAGSPRQASSVKEQFEFLKDSLSDTHLTLNITLFMNIIHNQ